jgi:hypothetical protein
VTRENTRPQPDNSVLYTNLSAKVKGNFPENADFSRFFSRVVVKFSTKHKILLCLVDNFAYLGLIFHVSCGKLSTTTNEKKPPISRRLRISDIRKSAGNTNCGT